MIQTDITLVNKQVIGPAWWQFTLTLPSSASPPLPGQYFLLDCTDAGCYLRRPIFPATTQTDTFTLHLRPDPDPGLAWLLSRPENTSLNVIGPLGQSFPLADHYHSVLLISDNPNLGPLLGQMYRALAVNRGVTLMMGGRRESTLFPRSALPPSVELHAATLDGSLGHRGPIIDLVTDELLRWADEICVIGSLMLYRTLRKRIDTIRLGHSENILYGLLNWTTLGCGVGACLGCAIETKAGIKLACLEGLVVDLIKVDAEMIDD